MGRRLTDWAWRKWQATDTAVRVIWTVDHLDAARRLQPGLAAAAEVGKPS